MELISLIVAIASLYASYHYGKKQISQSEFNSFRDNLKGIAACLTEMVDMLREDKIPHTAGNSLKTALEKFENLSGSLNVDEETKQKLQSFHSRLRQHLYDGKFLDDVIRGKILLVDKKVKEDMLIEMSRTAGYLQCTALTLKLNDPYDNL